MKKTFGGALKKNSMGFQDNGLKNQNQSLVFFLFVID